MTENALSRAIADRGVAVGCMLFEFDTPRVMRLLAAAGADFALFDLEHTAWDVESLRHAYAAGRGLRGTIGSKPLAFGPARISR